MTGTAGTTASASPGGRWPIFWLGVVAVGFAAVQIALVPLRTFHSWDEVIYASRFASDVPQIGPSPHRAPGMALLLAPVTMFTASFTVIRGYLTVVSAVGLFFAYRTWVAVSPRAAPLAAGLFAVIPWSLYFAHLAVPNVFTALAAVAAVGFFVRTGQPVRRRRTLVGLAGALAVMSLLRPTDAVFLAIAMAAGVLLARRWRRLSVAAAVFVGLAVGGVAWLIEAIASFGGPFERLAAMGAITEAGGASVLVKWTAVAVEKVLRNPVPAAGAAVTCLTVAIVAVTIVWKARKADSFKGWVLAVVAAAAIVLPYFALLSWVSSRYLLPGQGILAVVAAAAMVALVTVAAGKLRVVTAGVVIVAVLAYGGAQLSAAPKLTQPGVESRQTRQTWVARLADHGIRPRCLVSGYQAPAWAYSLGCEAGDNLSALPSRNNWAREVHRDLRKARSERVRFVAVLVGEQPPDRFESWPRIRLGKHAAIYAYFPPDQR